MVCIYCQGDLAVSNSRPQKKRNQTWRRRPCKACGAIFTSIEALDLSQSIIVVTGPGNGLQQIGRQVGTLPPHNGNKSLTVARLQPFDRDRLFISLYESLRHRPTATTDARGLADTAIAHIIKSNDHGQIDVRTIYEICLSTLRRFDRAAATHYAAFHPPKLRTAKTM